MAMDPTAATIAFTNMVDADDRRRAHHRDRQRRRRSPITVDEPATAARPIAVTPTAGGAWPAGATIVITVDATTTNLLGQTIAAAATVTFTAP